MVKVSRESLKNAEYLPENGAKSHIFTVFRDHFMSIYDSVCLALELLVEILKHGEEHRLRVTSTLPTQNSLKRIIT